VQGNRKRKRRCSKGQEWGRECRLRKISKGKHRPLPTCLGHRLNGEGTPGVKSRTGRGGWQLSTEWVNGVKPKEESWEKLLTVEEPQQSVPWPVFVGGLDVAKRNDRDPVGSGGPSGVRLVLPGVLRKKGVLDKLVWVVMGCGVLVCERALSFGFERSGKPRTLGGRWSGDRRCLGSGRRGGQDKGSLGEKGWGGKSGGNQRGGEGGGKAQVARRGGGDGKEMPTGGAKAPSRRLRDEKGHGEGLQGGGTGQPPAYGL